MEWNNAPIIMKSYLFPLSSVVEAHHSLYGTSDPCPPPLSSLCLDVKEKLSFTRTWWGKKQSYIHILYI